MKTNPNKKGNTMKVIIGIALAAIIGSFVASNLVRIVTDITNALQATGL